MKKTSGFNVQRLALAGLLMCGITTAWAADYASMITQAREQLQNERFTEALATAQEAVLAKPKDYKGHYYLAMAQMSLGQFDAAEAEAATALTQAPKSARPAVEKLAQTIKTNRKNADAASSKAESQSAAKELFLSCNATGTWVHYGESEPYERSKTYRIKDNSINEWDESTSTWITGFCNGDERKLQYKNKYSHIYKDVLNVEIACDVNPVSINYVENYIAVSNKNEFQRTRQSFQINRKTGKYTFRDDFTNDEKLEKLNSKIYEQLTVAEGTCKLTSDPASPVGNKF